MQDERCGHLMVIPSNHSFNNEQVSLAYEMCNSDSSLFYTAGENDSDPRMAGLRIFSSIMLNAWRKRRDEVKRLVDEVNELKRDTIKSRNQIYVFNTLFRVERKRNDELCCQLKKSLNDIDHTKSSLESLATSVISLRSDKELLEQHLQNREQKLDLLDTMLSQTKSELFRTMTLQRELQSRLTIEQRKVQTLENQKIEIINEIRELNDKAKHTGKNLRNCLDNKIKECSELENIVKDLKCKYESLQRCEEKLVCESSQKEKYLRNEIDHLTKQLENLDSNLKKSNNQTKKYWQKSQMFVKTIFRQLHVFAYILLPTTPRPKAWI